MGNKANIQTQINTIADAALNPASTVRSVLGTDPDSLLEAVYGSTVTELTSGTLNITTAGDFNYVLYFQKVGRFISLTGTFTATADVSASGLIATITDTDWNAQSNVFSSTAYKIGGDTIGFTISANQIRVQNNVFTGEQFFINTLLYNSVN